MSEDILEIHRMIRRIPPGDDDQIASVLEKMLQKLADMEREIAELPGKLG